MTTEGDDSAQAAHTEGAAIIEGAGPLADLVISLVLAVVGVATAVRGAAIGLGDSATDAAGLAPIVYGSAVAVPAAAIAVRTLRGGKLGASRGQDNWQRALAVPALGLVCIVVYATLLPRIGYLIATALFSLVVLYLLRWRRLRGVVAALALTFAIYGLFSLLLNVPLP